METNRSKSATTTRVRRSVEAVKTHLEGERKLFDKAIFELLRGDDEWNGEPGLLTSVPGVGLTTAAEPPEPDTINRRQIAATVGLAPFGRDSGTMKGKRFIGGRKTVRVALHMAALTATRRNPPVAALCARLRKHGSSFCGAMVARARKLLNTLAARNEHWKPQKA